MEKYDNNDEMLKLYFNDKKQEIADNGFSKKVMQKLPQKTDRSWIVLIFAATGMALSLFLGIKIGLFQNVLIFLEKVPFYYLLGAVFFFPLVSTLVIFLSQHKNYRLV